MAATCIGDVDCKRQPYYALQQGTEPVLCFHHKSADHIDVRNKRCEVETCKTKPQFGYDGETARFCANHKEEGMFNLRSKRCQSEGCVKYASCGQVGKTPEYCRTHKTPGMVNLISRRCSVEGCETYASYGTEGLRDRYCAKHKKDGMLNLTVKNCQAGGCVSQPAFNFSGQRKPRFCATHAQEGMVHVLDRHCSMSGCDRQPIYGNSGETAGKPLWCPKHRPSESHDVKTARCQEPNCQKHPSYGYNSDRVRRRCRLHKLDDMLDVKSPRCERPGCAKQPCCGHLGAKARFCSGHKHNGMVNLKTRAFRCKHKGPDDEEASTPTATASSPAAKPNKRSSLCNRACRYAYPDQPAKFCAKHQRPGMVDVLNPRCSVEDCQGIPTHAFDGKQPTFCMAHTSAGMKVVMPESPNVLHWSSDARKKAAAAAIKSKRLTSERQAVSAKVSPLPSKRTAQGARDVRDDRVNAAGPSPLSRGMEPAGPQRDTAPTQMVHEVLGNTITPAELALAFGTNHDPLTVVDHVANGLEPATAAAAAAAAAASFAASTASSALPATAGDISGIAAVDDWRDVAARVVGEGPAQETGRETIGHGPAERIGPGIGDLGTSYSTIPVFPAPLMMPITGLSLAAAGAAMVAAMPPIPPPPISPPPSLPSLPGIDLVRADEIDRLGLLSAPERCRPEASLPLMAVGNMPDGGASSSTAANISPPLARTPVSASAATMPEATNEHQPLAAAPPSGLSPDGDWMSLPAPSPAAIAAVAGVGPPVISAQPPVPSLTMLTVPESLRGESEAMVGSRDSNASKGSQCSFAGCSAKGTFGYPKPGAIATRCLTHCEEGMHRLAADSAPSAGKRSRPADDTGVDVDKYEEATPSNGALNDQRSKKARDGMMVLAGAVASQGENAHVPDGCREAT